MAVLLPDRRLGVRRRAPAAADEHGYEYGSPAWGPLVGPWPGRASEGPDAPVIDEAGGRRWVLAVDPKGWPLKQGDLVVDPDTGLEWLVITADLRNHSVTDTVDYIRVEASLREDGGTRP